MRTPPGRYPEYHTSADDLDLVRAASLADSLAKCSPCCPCSRTMRRTSTRTRSASRSSAGAASTRGGRKDESLDELALLWVLNLSDSAPLAARRRRALRARVRLRPGGGRRARSSTACSRRPRESARHRQRGLHRLAPLSVPRRARPRGGRGRHRLLPCAAALRRNRRRPSRRRRRTSASSNRATSPASTPSCTWPSSRTTPRAARPGGHVRRSTTAARCTSPRRRRPPASSASSTRRPAASTAQRRRTSSTRSRRSTRRPRTRSARSSSSATSRDGRRRLLADLPAQRDRLRRIAADALRHRPQQPLRPRLDDEGDPDGERRHAVAAARPRPRHLQGGRVRARRAARARPRRRSSTSATLRRNYQIREIAEIVGRVFPDCEVTIGGRGAGQPQLSRLVRQDPRGAARSSAARWDAERGARQLLDVFSRVESRRDEDFLAGGSRG